MNIQITDYGVSLITDSKQPLKIANAILGSSYGYTPSKTASGIKGSQVYATDVLGPRVINANVVKYEIGIDYDVGPFTFGEIAYMDDKDKCVAIAVAENPIAKLVQNNKDRGNSIRVDAYLSMVGGNFDMWIESIGSNIDFYVPIISSFDLLPPVVSSDPNFYIVDSVSSNASATLAYAGTNGIWEFDTYLFSNTRQFTITGATSTSVTIDVSSLDDEAKHTLASKFYGDKLIEFSSGKLYSICRTPLSVLVQGNSAVISFQTALAELPKVDDTILFFSRTDLSISDLVLPVATENTLGAIKLGEGLVGSIDGTTSVDFPVTSVNGQGGDVNLTADDIDGLADVAISGDYNDLKGKPNAYTLPVASATRLGGVKPQSDFSIGADGSLSLARDYVQSVDGIKPDSKGNVNLPEPEPVEGLVNPTQLPSNANLNNYTDAGLFYASSGTSFTNAPDIEANAGLTLEVIPIKGLDGACVQRYTCAGHMFIRVHFMDWSEWSEAGTGGGSGSGQIASYSQLGSVYIKRNTGLEVGTDGGLNAKAGNGITINANGINAAVTSVNGRTGAVTIDNQDVWQALQQYMDVAGGLPHLSDAENGEWNSRRINLRQMALGAFVMGGLWDATTNRCDDIDEPDGGVRLVDGGYLEDLTTGEQLDGTGYIFYCSVAGDTLIDGLSGWQIGDLVLGLGDVGWIRLVGDFPVPDTEGAILYSSQGRWIKLAKGANNSILVINASGNFQWLPKGSNNSILVINNSGNFQWLSKGANESILMVGTNGQYQWLAKGAANTVLGVDASGKLTWLDQITTTQINIK